MTQWTTMQKVILARLGSCPKSAKLDHEEISEEAPLPLYTVALDDER